jgi:hypothetical protein
MATTVEGVSSYNMEADVAAMTDATANGENPKEEVALKHLYEQSTQYKYWRYTQAALDEIRRKANKEAVAVIGENIKEEREQAGHRLHSIRHPPQPFIDGIL